MNNEEMLQTQDGCAVCGEVEVEFSEQSMWLCESCADTWERELESAW